jgi:hypothetical protein
MKRVSKDGVVTHVIHPTVSQDTYDQLRKLSIHMNQPMTEVVRRILTTSVARALNKLESE